MPSFRRYLKFLALAVLLYILYLIRSHYLFESFLQSHFITLSDFPEDYITAFNASLATSTPLEYNHSLLPTIHNPHNIPPKIHFIWFKDLYTTQLNRTDHQSQIPHEGANTPQTCLTNSPGFEVTTWNTTAARDLLSTHYPWFLPTYDSYRYPIQRVDAFKYFVLLHYGGVYMDLDISCRRPLTALLQFPAWFPKAGTAGVVNNDVFAARKGHPLMKSMTENLQKTNFNLLFPYLTIYWSTGPQFTTGMVRAWWETGMMRTVARGKSKADADPDSYFILPDYLYSHSSPYFGHRTGGTWHGKDVEVILYLVDRPWLIALVVFTLAMPMGTCVLLRRRRHVVKPK